MWTQMHFEVHVVQYSGSLLTVINNDDNNNNNNDSIRRPRWIRLYNRVEKHSQLSKLRMGQATTMPEYILVTDAELASEAGERG